MVKDFLLLLSVSARLHLQTSVKVCGSLTRVRNYAQNWINWETH